MACFTVWETSRFGTLRLITEKAEAIKVFYRFFQLLILSYVIVVEARQRLTFSVVISRRDSNKPNIHLQKLRRYSCRRRLSAIITIVLNLLDPRALLTERSEEANEEFNN